MRTFNEFINEAFDSVADDLELVKSGSGWIQYTFTVTDGREFQINFRRFTRLSSFDKSIAADNPGYDNDFMWMLSFRLADVEDETEFKMTNAGKDQFLILGSVVAAIKDTLKRKKEINVLGYTADKGEKSRIKVYRRSTERLIDNSKFYTKEVDLAYEVGFVIFRKK